MAGCSVYVYISNVSLTRTEINQACSLLQTVGRVYFIVSCFSWIVFSILSSWRCVEAETTGAGTHAWLNTCSYEHRFPFFTNENGLSAFKVVRFLLHCNFLCFLMSIVHTVELYDHSLDSLLFIIVKQVIASLRVFYRDSPNFLEATINGY